MEFLEGAATWSSERADRHRRSRLHRLPEGRGRPDRGDRRGPLAGRRNRLSGRLSPARPHRIAHRPSRIALRSAAGGDVARRQRGLGLRRPDRRGGDHDGVRFVPRRGRRIRLGRPAWRRGRAARRGGAPGGGRRPIARRPSHPPALRGSGAQRRRLPQRGARVAFRAAHLAHGPHARSAPIPRPREILHLLLRQVGTVPGRSRGGGEGTPEGRPGASARKPAAHRRNRQSARHCACQPRRHDGGGGRPRPSRRGDDRRVPDHARSSVGVARRRHGDGHGCAERRARRLAFRQRLGAAS